MALYKFRIIISVILIIIIVTVSDHCKTSSLLKLLLILGCLLELLHFVFELFANSVRTVTDASTDADVLYLLCRLLQTQIV